MHWTCILCPSYMEERAEDEKRLEDHFRLFHPDIYEMLNPIRSLPVEDDS